MANMGTGSDAANASGSTNSVFNSSLIAPAAAGAMAGIAAVSYFSVGGVSFDTPQIAAAIAAGGVYAYVYPMNMANAAVSTTDASKIGSALTSAAMMSVVEAGVAAGAVLMGMAGLSITDSGIFAAGAAAGVYAAQRFV